MRMDYGVMTGDAGISERRGVKVCPRCGSKVFEDMDVCYGCLYDFSRDGDGRPHRSVGDGMGETPQRLEVPVRPAGSGGRDAATARPRGVAQDDRADSAGVGEGPRPTRWDFGGGASGEKPPAPLAGLSDDAPSSSGDQPGDAPVPVEAVGEAWDDLDEVWDEAPSVCVSASAERTMSLPVVAGASVRKSATAGDGGGRPRLRVSTEGATFTFPVPPEGLTVGRERDNAVCVASGAVSRHHLRVLPHADAFEVVDLGATNPALLNGRMLVGSGRLGIYDAVELQGTRVVLRFVPA